MNIKIEKIRYKIIYNVMVRKSLFIQNAIKLRLVVEMANAYQKKCSVMEKQTVPMKLMNLKSAVVENI
jgi:hypothetical protein